RVAVRVTRRGAVRLEFNRALKLANGCSKIDIVEVHNFAERAMRFRQIWIELESFKCGLSRFCGRVTSGSGCVKGKQYVGVCQTGIRERIIWIASDRLLV